MFSFKNIKLISFSTVLAIFVFLPTKLLAFGQLTEPIIVDNAMRGQTITEEIFLINNKNKTITIELSAEGDIADWVEYYKSEEKTDVIEQIEVSSSSNIGIKARITLPDSLPNGKYVGTLVTTFENKDDNDSSTSTYASITQVVEREVAISVTDEEDVSLAVNIIPNKFDFVKGEKMSIKLLYFNTGNVELRPNLDIKIMQEDEVLYNRIFPYFEKDNGIKPLERKEVEVDDVRLEDLDFGRYNVVLTVVNGLETVNENVVTINYNEKKDAITSAVGQTEDKNDAGFFTSIIGKTVSVILLIMLALGMVIIVSKRFSAKRI